MEMEKWIELRMNKIKETFGERLEDYEYNWIHQTLQSTWEYGHNEGYTEASEIYRTKISHRSRK